MVRVGPFVRIVLQLGFQRSTPMRQSHKPARPARRLILGAHLVFHGCGHWLSNDPRGSGSEETRKEELKDLGEVHVGRKKVQPPRTELRQFYRKAEPLLDHD